MSGVVLPPIAVIGKMGAGKTTACDLLAEYHYERFSHASPLREAAVALYGEDARNDRGLLQGLGKHLRLFDVNVFVKSLCRRAKERIDLPARACVDDCRFPNEVKCLELLGFVFVRVEAPRHLRIDRLKANGKLQDEAQLDDASETALDDYEPAYTITNDRNDKPELLAQMVEVLNKERW